MRRKANGCTALLPSLLFKVKSRVNLRGSNFITVESTVLSVRGVSGEPDDDNESNRGKMKATEVAAQMFLPRDGLKKFVLLRCVVVSSGCC